MRRGRMHRSGRKSRRRHTRRLLSYGNSRGGIRMS